MCTGTIYRMTRCGHFIVSYTSHCRRYHIANPPPKRPGKHTIMLEPPKEPCPKLHSGNDKPVSVVSIEDSCATCMPRAQQWDATYFQRWMGKEIKKRAATELAEGDQLAPAVARDDLLKIDKCTQDRLGAIEWSIIPASEPVYPPSRTVEDDRGLSAAWIGFWHVWGDEEFLQEQQQLYEEEVERRRKEQVKKRREKAVEKQRGQEAVERPREQEGDKEDESDYDDEEESRDEHSDAGSSIGGYLFSDEFVHGDQDQSSGRPHPQLRKQKGREALGGAEFFSFATLDEDDGHDESYHIDDKHYDDGDDMWMRISSEQPRTHYPQLRKQRGRETLGEAESSSFATLDEDDRRDDAYHVDDKNDDDLDDVWLRISSEQPRDNRTTTTGFSPNHSHGNSQATPDVTQVNRSKRFSTQAVQGSGKRFDLKPFIPSQHQQR